MRGWIGGPTASLGPPAPASSPQHSDKSCAVLAPPSHPFPSGKLFLQEIMTSPPPSEATRAGSAGKARDATWMWPGGQPSPAHSDLGARLLPGFELVSDLMAVSKRPLVLNSFGS